MAQLGDLTKTCEELPIAPMLAAIRTCEACAKPNLERPNLLLNPNLNDGWSKLYNENIVWNDISPPVGVDVDGTLGVIGATSNVVGFDDLDEVDDMDEVVAHDRETSGYWYSYGDYALMEPGNTYTASVYVKTSQAGPLQVRAYTGDNSEAGRFTGEYQPVTAADGWLMLVWTFLNPLDSNSNSLSFEWNGLETPAVKIWLSSPRLELGTCTPPDSNSGGGVFGRRQVQMLSQWLDSDDPSGLVCPVGMPQCTAGNTFTPRCSTIVTYNCCCEGTAGS